jgi:hypothetical protein
MKFKWHIESTALFTSETQSDSMNIIIITFLEGHQNLRLLKKIDIITFCKNFEKDYNLLSIQFNMQK